MPTLTRWWCLWTTWGTPAAMATSRVTPASGGLTTPRSRPCEQEQGPLRRPFPVQLHFRGATHQGVPPPYLPSTPRGEGRAEMPGKPQDPLVPRLLPTPTPPPWPGHRTPGCLSHSHGVTVRDTRASAHRDSAPASSFIYLLCSQESGPTPRPEPEPGRGPRTLSQVQGWLHGPPWAEVLWL